MCTDTVYVVEYFHNPLTAEVHFSIYISLYKESSLDWRHEFSFVPLNFDLGAVGSSCRSWIRVTLLLTGCYSAKGVGLHLRLFSHYSCLTAPSAYGNVFRDNLLLLNSVHPSLAQNTGWKIQSLNCIISSLSCLPSYFWTIFQMKDAISCPVLQLNCCEL